MVCVIPNRMFTVADVLFLLAVLVSHKVEIFRPMSSSRSAHSPSREYEGFYSHACYTYHDLPARYWKKYQFASQFVQLVRSKTPKVTLYSDQAKCMLMENAPNPDFEACFYSGKLLSTCHIQLHQCINCLKFNWNPI